MDRCRELENTPWSCHGSPGDWVMGFVSNIRAFGGSRDLPPGSPGSPGHGTRACVPTLQPTSETWRLTSLVTRLATSRRCSWSCSRLVHLGPSPELLTKVQVECCGHLPDPTDMVACEGLPGGSLEVSPHRLWPLPPPLPILSLNLRWFPSGSPGIEFECPGVCSVTLVCMDR